MQLLDANIAALNKLYETSSTTSELTTAQIGSYAGDFTIEHTVKINSIPADGDDNKGSTNGFFVRFNPSDGIGAGWYLTANSNNTANVYWKGGSNRNNATALATNNSALTLGQTYIFKYDFTNVATGDGAYVTVTITDEAGNQINKVENLNLRNMSFDKQKTSPLSTVQIYNQANANSTSSVEFANARYYTTSEIAVNGQNVTLNIGCLTDMKGYAAKYSNGILTDLADITPTTTGQSTVLLQFEPDKVFIWNDMTPVDFWQKTE